MVGPRRLLEVRDGQAALQTRPVEVSEFDASLPIERSNGADPLDALRSFIPRRRVQPAEGMPRFTGGAVGALAYDNIPLSSAGKLEMFSPEFQSLTTDKGAMILHMLRWVVGDQKFDQIMRDFASKYAGKSATVDDFRALTEKDYGDKLTWFFSQWLDSTGAPEFKTKYSVYRLGNNKGFRVVGQIGQDLDLFRMPVELKIDTDGKSEEKRIDVSGTDSAFVTKATRRRR